MAHAKINSTQHAALSADLQAEYTQDDSGMFVLNVEGAESLPVVADLQRNLSAAREDVKREKKSAGALRSALGDRDAAEVAAKLARLEELGDLDKLSTDKKVQERIRSIEAQFGEKIQALEKGFAQEKGGYESEISRLLVDAETARVLSKPEFAGSSHRLLSGPIKERTRVAKGDNGQFHVEVLDSSGNPAYGDGTNLMSLEQLISSMKNDADYSGAFGGAKHSGAGSAPDSGARGAGSNGPQGSGKDVVISHEDSLDHSKYMSARAEAEKAGGNLVVDSPWGNLSPGEPANESA